MWIYLRGQTQPGSPSVRIKLLTQKSPEKSKPSLDRSGKEGRGGWEKKTKKKASEAGDICLLKEWQREGKGRG